jgi:hypothetical protein
MVTVLPVAWKNSANIFPRNVIVPNEKQEYEDSIQEKNNCLVIWQPCLGLVDWQQAVLPKGLLLDRQHNQQPQITRRRKARLVRTNVHRARKNARQKSYFCSPSFWAV